MGRYLSFLFFAAAFRSMAAIDCVLITETDGTRTLIPIEDATEMRFTGSSLTVGELDFPIERLQRYEFADSKTEDLETIVLPGMEISIDPIGRFTFSDLDNDTQITVHNIKGQSFPFGRVGNMVDITGLSPDLYIITIGDNSFKFVKR